MTQLKEDCAKYLKIFISNFKGGVQPHDWNDCHYAIFSEFYPKGWHEIRFEPSQKKRADFIKLNKLDSNIFSKENCDRVQKCMEYFPTYLEEIT